MSGCVCVGRGGQEAGGYLPMKNFNIFTTRVSAPVHGGGTSVLN